jgi:hypothetical protein
VIQDSELIQKVRIELEELFEADPLLANHPTLRLAMDQANAAENLAKG